MEGDVKLDPTCLALELDQSLRNAQCYVFDLLFIHVELLHEGIVVNADLKLSTGYLLAFSDKLLDVNREIFYTNCRSSQLYLPSDHMEIVLYLPEALLDNQRTLGDAFLGELLQLCGRLAPQEC